MIHIEKNMKCKRKVNLKKLNTHNANLRYIIYSHILLIGLPVIYATFMPYLMDYYVFQPDMSYVEYCNLRIVDRYYNFEMLLIALAIFAIWCMTKRIGVTLFLITSILFALTYASNIKYTARGELFRFSDLKLTEAAGAALHFLDIKCRLSQLGIVLIMLLFCICGFLIDLFCKKYTFHYKYEKIFSLVFTIIGCICLMSISCYTNFFMNSRETIDGLDVIGLGNENYVLYNFLKDDSLSNINIEDTEMSYIFFHQNSINSNTEIILNKNQYPSIIVIMNESWWNTDNIISDTITFSSDPMEPYKSMAKQCSSGYLSANIFGGGTVSSEAEFLTGLNTKYFVSDTGIYSELQKRKIPSIVNYFHDMGYDTVAIHPYYGEFYGRDTIYPQLGFDKVIFEENMQYADIYSRYISDESLMKQIIDEYEKVQNTQQFIFAVSIANHIRVLEYKQDFADNYPYPISIVSGGEFLDKKDRDDLINYINGIYLANEAFVQITSYFAQVDTPIVVVMYGDHAPSFSEDILSLFGLEGSDWETQRRLYSVPVLMWSNFDTNKIHFSGENINYLPQMVLEYARLPKSDMSQILLYEREILKANTRRIVTDSNGLPIQTYNKKQTEAVKHFKVVDYDILFGNSIYRDKVWKPYGAGE